MNNNVLIFGVIAVALIGVFLFIGSDEKEIAEKNIDTAMSEEMSDMESHEMGIDHHLSEAKITKKSADFTADLKAMGLMPLNGENGAVGYGIITDKGTDQVIVATTHGGVLDSEMQKDASDPIWHNHIVRLGEVAMCGENPGVVDITFESPGDIEVKEQGVVMAEVPAMFSGTHSLSKEKISFAPGTDVQGVVQFSLEPKFSETNELQAVCVTNIEEVSFDLI
ncbi:MAG: hypothetical protein R3B60_03755 [Candidatus Paceibacterota bacterium]